jgi:hypothetical protein
VTLLAICYPQLYLKNTALFSHKAVLLGLLCLKEEGIVILSNAET